MSHNTLYLRLEGAMQAWGNQESQFAVRRSSQCPTKSGVVGLLCAALGVTRDEAPAEWLPKLTALNMGVRIDRPGFRWWDYHTVGADIPMPIAEGGTKLKTMLSRREYLCDASFLVALQGPEEIITTLANKLRNPVWTIYLGRKNCPPGRPLLERDPTANHPDILTALCAKSWQPRYADDKTPKRLLCFTDWQPTPQAPEAPPEALIWYDVPISFNPPAHLPRFVLKHTLDVGENGIFIAGQPLTRKAPTPQRTRADYQNTEYKKARAGRIVHDNGVCVFCKMQSSSAAGMTVQHITYKRAGGNETHDDLRTLCRLCHDAVTLLEYGHGMTMDRINPEDPKWHKDILEKRQEIINFRSLETRRRKLLDTDEEDE